MRGGEQSYTNSRKGFYLKLKKILGVLIYLLGRYKSEIPPEKSFFLNVSFPLIFL